MFDIGFSELLLIAVVALLVLGPERLPKAARLAGLWIRKARTQWNAVKAELENEIADEELRRNLREASDAMRDGVQQVRTLPDAIRNDPVSTDAGPADATPAMAAIDPAQHDASQSGPTQTTQDEHASDVPASDSDSIQHDQLTHDHDPAQLSPLDPDPTLMQTTDLPSSSRARSDG
jgi:sec-independent protein translocase protein TatB